jgi:hypothetical protein
MATLNRSPRGKLRGQPANTDSLDDVVQETFRLRRKHHLDYDQTKYVVERVRRRLGLEPPRTRSRTVARLEPSEIERLIQTTYRSTYRYRSPYGLMLKTLFQTGARVDEFVHIRVEDLLLDGDSPQLRIIHAKRGADRYVPILPALADELHTRLQGRHTGFLFESNRHRAIRPERCKPSSQLAPAPLTSRNASIRTSSGIPLRRSCSILGWCRLIRCRSFWGTCIFDHADICGDEPAGPRRQLHPGPGRETVVQRGWVVFAPDFAEILGFARLRPITRRRGRQVTSSSPVWYHGG